MQFPHLSFQECFAGYALALKLNSTSTPEREALDLFLQKYKYHPRFRLVLRFMMGEAVRQAAVVKQVRSLRRMLRLLERPPKEVAGLQHLAL